MNPDNQNSVNDSLENVYYSEKWERFMLLWSTTPEVFIGSCLLSIFAFIGTIFLSKFSKNTILETMDDDIAQNINFDAYAKFKPGKSGKGISKRLSPKQKEIMMENRERVDFLKYKSKYKKAAEKLEATLSMKEIQEEKKVQQEQLKAIFDLMKNKSDAFGMEDENEIKEQMKLYI